MDSRDRIEQRGGWEQHSPTFRAVLLTTVGAFVVFPLVQAIVQSGGGAGRGWRIALAVVFVIGYVAMMASMAVADEHGSVPSTRIQAPAFGAMLAGAALLTLVDAAGWAYLFSYCAAASTLIAGDRPARAMLLLSTVLAAALPALAGASGGAVLGTVSGAAGVGLIMYLLRDLRARHHELRAARSELARLAVAEERERFARDLHDLLGHSLSVIALKADLAGRLLHGDVDRAGAEVHDIETVARKALSEVRDAVGGYRRPTLDGELEGARVALVAAGVECEIDWDGEPLEPESESVLAWAVREGATNVIRHSAARRCIVRVLASKDTDAVEVLDDGMTGAGTTVLTGGVNGTRVNGTGVNGNGDGGRGGHGLAGLQERVAALRGQMAAGPQAGGGYRLSVSVPRGGR